MTLPVLIVAILLGLACGTAASRFIDWVFSLASGKHHSVSMVENVLIGSAASAFWLCGFKALLITAAFTVVLWPVFLGLYFLVRYRPHWFTIWSVAKALFAVLISPFILLVFFFDKPAFIDIMSALWPHLDIFTPDGKLYLRRWFMTPKGQGYHPRFLHLILLPDEGRDPHDHPGAFTTTILWNGYDEEVYFPRRPGPDPEKYDWLCPCGCESGQGRPGNPWMVIARKGMTLENPEGHTHIVKLIGPTLTWVKGWKKGRKWGFWKLDPEDHSKDEWIESEAYGEKGDERKSWTIDGK